ncbi:uncharacterized protein [Struthio camelus]|uniref:uncharacterized protein isoform X2 n=1 Tax=Struthio camelus TaxID=8801 RepID=UPI003603C1E1
MRGAGGSGGPCAGGRRRRRRLLDRALGRGKVKLCPSAKVSEMEKMPTSSKGYLVKTAKKLLSKIIEFNPEEEIKLLCKFGAYLDYKELSGKGRGKVEKQILNLGKEWETQGEGEKSNLCKTEEPGCLCGETPPAPDSDGKMNKRLKKNVIRKQKNQLNCIQRDSWKKQNVFLPWAFIVKKINKVVLGTAVVNDNQESFSEENIILMSCIFIILTSYKQSQSSSFIRAVFCCCEI